MANNQYLVTESDVSDLLKLSGLPISFQSKFTRDYVSIKGDINNNNYELNQLTIRVQIAENDIDAIEIRLDQAETDISDIDSRLTTAEGDLATVTSDLSDHEADQSAHGATGDIVGTNDYCTTSIGGTVLLAEAVADVTPVSVSAAITPAAAGAAYVQADAATWVNALFEHRTNINQLATAVSNLITQLNLLLANSRTAKQLEP